MSFLRPATLSIRLPLKSSVSRPLHTLVRWSSTDAAAGKYEYILTSTPRPGVGQSASPPSIPPCDGRLTREGLAQSRSTGRR